MEILHNDLEEITRLTLRGKMSYEGFNFLYGWKEPTFHTPDPVIGHNASNKPPSPNK